MVKDKERPSVEDVQARLAREKAGGNGAATVAPAAATAKKDSDGTAAALDPSTAETAKKAKPNHPQALKDRVVVELKGISAAYTKVKDAFADAGFPDCADYYDRQANKALTQAAWYDDKAKKEALVKRLKDQLDKLEAEMDAE